MKAIVLMVGIATLLTALVVFGANTHRAPTSHIQSGYTMALTVVENGKLVSRVQRQVKGNGDFMEDTDHLNPDGTVSKHTRLAGTAKQGAVVIDESNQKLTYLGRAGLISAVSETSLKSQGFDREDSLLGFKVIVQRSCDVEKRCTEYWIAPDLGSDNLKVDLDFGDGRRLTKEAVSLVKGEPYFQIPNYPVETGSRVANPAKP